MFNNHFFCARVFFFFTSSMLYFLNSFNPLQALVVVQSLSYVWLLATTWTTACQASLSFIIYLSLLKLMSTESVMASNHLILSPPPPPPAFNLSQHQCLFQWVSSLYQVAKVLDLQLQNLSFQWIFRVYFL